MSRGEALSRGRGLRAGARPCGQVSTGPPSSMLSPFSSAVAEELKMTSCKIPFRGNSRKAIAIRTVVTHSARKEAPGSLLGAGDIPYLYLGGNYAGAGIYQSVSSCPPRLVYFTVCKIHLNKKFNNRREMVPGRGEECQRQREPSGARATASSLEERARWVEGWTETPGSGRRRERENSGGEEGKAGRTPSGGGMAGGSRGSA